MENIMKNFFFVLALFATPFVVAEESKPKLNLYVYENRTEEATTEVLFMTEFQCQDPNVQPYARALGVAEVFAQSIAASGNDLHSFFKKTAQPRQLEDHLSQLDRTIKLRFILPNEKTNSLDVLLDAIQQMPAQIGNINRIIHEETKAALADSIHFFDSSDIDLVSEYLREQFFELTPNGMLNTFMKNNFPKSESFLIIAYPKNCGVTKEWVAKRISDLNVQWKVEKHDSEIAKSGLIEKSIENADPGIVVDGKIYMDSPRFWHKQWFGMSLGIGLFVMGLFLLIPTFGISMLFLGIPGIIFLCHTYLSDPSVVEKMRRDIANTGFHYAYRKQCIEVILTPFERRELFVRDIFDRSANVVRKLYDFPAYYALNSYNFRSLEMREFLYREEVEQLTLFQSDYYRSVDKIEEKLKELQAELAALLVPFQVMRDAAVEAAYSEYNNCSAVVIHNLYIHEYEQDKNEVETEYRKGNISNSERDDVLKALTVELKEKLMVIESYIKEAENHLNNRLAVIKADYKISVIACKNSINYYARKENLKNIEWDMNSYYSELVSQYVMNQMNPHDNHFSDVLDLRTIK